LLLNELADGRFVALATTTLFLEYEDVLKRPEQLAAMGLGPDDADRFLAALASAVEPVDVHFRWRPVVPDAADEMVLEAAINGRADALVTHNVRDFAGAAEQFGIAVLRPADALKRVST